MSQSSRKNSNGACPPFLRWAGSKRRLLPVLQKFWLPHHKRYVEPFAGSACLFFALDPPKALLGDVNEELIATFIEVKYRVEPLLRELGSIPQWNKREYLRLRSLDPSDLSKQARAARFIYLNRFCFNGIYRTNLRGQFNVPYSGDGCGAIPDGKVFRKCSNNLRNARFVNGDFEAVLKQAVRGDFVYMDPPYAVRAKRVFRQYDPSAFACADIERLRSWMERLDSDGVDFLISYADSEEANILKAGFWHTTVNVRRNIAGFASHRAMSGEVLISNSKGAA
jgi:DNA adenine methylase